MDVLSDADVWMTVHHADSNDESSSENKVSQSKVFVSMLVSNVCQKSPKNGIDESSKAVSPLGSVEPGHIGV